nr:uncharacterized protein LOC125643519 [Caretta caretta]
MQQSLPENQKVQEWRETERRLCQQNVDCWHQSTEQLLSIMECQADSMQVLTALQMEQIPPQPLYQNSFPCSLMSPPTHFPQHPVSYRHQLPPTPVASPPSPANYDPYLLHSTPITMHFSQSEVQHSLHGTPDRKAEYDTRTYANLGLSRSPPRPLPSSHTAQMCHAMCVSPAVVFLFNK